MRRGVGRQSKVGGYPAEQIDPARPGVNVRGEDLVHFPSVVLGKSSLRGILAPCSQVLHAADPDIRRQRAGHAKPGRIPWPLARLIPEHAIDLWLGKQGVNEHRRDRLSIGDRTPGRKARAAQVDGTARPDSPTQRAT